MKEVDVDTTGDPAALGARPTAARPRLPRRLIAGQHLRHNILLLGANVLVALCGYLLQTLLAHRMGLAAYGAVASLLSVAATTLIPTQVIATIVARYAAVLDGAGKLAELNDLVRRLTAILLLAGLGVTAVVALGSGAVAAFLHLEAPTPVIIIAVMIGVSFVAPINQGVVQGLRRFSWYAALVALPWVLRMVLAGGLVVLGWGVDGAMLGILLGAIVSYLVSFKPLGGLLHGPRLPGGSLRPLWSYSVTAAITLTITVVLVNFDTPLAKHFLPARQAGLYAAMALVGKIVLVVSNSIVMAVFPRFAALHGRGERATRAVLEATLSVLAPCLVLEAAYCLAPALLMRLLFGPAFVAVAGQLAPYGLAMLLLGVAQVFIYYFLSTDARLYMAALLAAGGLQAALFAVRHQSVEQLVQALVAAYGLLVLALCGLYALDMGRARRAAAPARGRPRASRSHEV